MLFQSIFGFLSLLAIAYLLSENRRVIEFQAIFLGIIIHFGLAVVFLKIPLFQDIFFLLHQAVLVIEQATTQGTAFVFGYLGGGDSPFTVTNASSSVTIFAFKVLPIILIISVLSSLLYYYRLLPNVVRLFSFLLQKSFNIGGAVGVCAAANAFIGMVEAPLLVKPYIKERTRGEIFTIMVAGMATISGTVMVLYANVLADKVPGVMGHILTASLLNVFAALIISMLIIPHQDDRREMFVELPQQASSSMDAIVRGTADGMKLMVNVTAMLIVLISLVALMNQLLSLLPMVNAQPITLQRILGVIAAPLTFLVGIPFSEMFTTGSLMGTKVILNEFIAYLDLLHLPPGTLSERSIIIMIYALCGFANMGSLGIMVGGLTTMAPEQRAVIIDLGMKSVLAGVLATCFTANVVGIILLF